MKCPNCRREISKRDKHCPYCGIDLATVRKKKKIRPEVIVPVVVSCCCAAAVAVSIVVSRKEPSAGKLQARLEEGNKFLEEGNYEMAEVAFQKALQIDPKSTEAKVLLAEVYTQQDSPKTREAEALLREAAKNPPITNPDTYQIYKDLAEMYKIPVVEYTFPETSVSRKPDSGNNSKDKTRKADPVVPRIDIPEIIPPDVGDRDDPVSVPTVTKTPTPTATETPMPEPTVTETPTPEPTVTETPVPEPTVTETPTPEPTVTETPMPEPTVTETPTPEPTVTETPTPEPIEAAPTETPAPEPTPTETPTPEPIEAAPTETPTPEPTPTETPTPEPTPTETPTPEPSPTETPTPEPTPTETPVPTETPTPEPTPTETPVPTPTETPEPTLDPFDGGWDVIFVDPTDEPSVTEAPSEEAFISVTPSVTVTPSVSVTPTPDPFDGGWDVFIDETPVPVPETNPSITPELTPTITPTVTPTLIPDQQWDVIIPNPEETSSNDPNSNGSLPEYPGMTLPGYPAETLPGNPSETLPGYPPETLPGYPAESLPGAPADTPAGETLPTPGTDDGSVPAETPAPALQRTQKEILSEYQMMNVMTVPARDISSGDFGSANGTYFSTITGSEEMGNLKLLAVKEQNGCMGFDLYGVSADGTVMLQGSGQASAGFGSAAPGYDFYGNQYIADTGSAIVILTDCVGKNQGGIPAVETSVSVFMKNPDGTTGAGNSAVMVNGDNPDALASVFAQAGMNEDWIYSYAAMLQSSGINEDPDQIWNISSGVPGSGFQSASALYHISGTEYADSGTMRIG